MAQTAERIPLPRAQQLAAALREAFVAPAAQREMTEASMQTWHGCYDDSWKGLISDDAFAHPAKFARGLIRRIYAHALDVGHLKPGDTVVDPFGGVALGGLDASMLGLHWLGCELEPKFHALAEKNIAMWNRYQPSGSARIVCGDSRRLVEVLGPVLAQSVVSSPPWQDNCEGVMRADKFNDPDAYARQMMNKGHGCSLEAAKRKMAKQNEGASYGTTPGQLGSLPPGDAPAAVVSSPPYSAGTVHDGNGIDQSKLTGNKPGKNTQAKAEGYGQTPGNLSGMAVEGIVSSPPWENQEPSHAQGSKFEARHRELHPTKLAKDRPGLFSHEYGNSEGQIGNSTGETFWSAARLIVQQCHAILRPGGVAYWVVKAFCRKGAIVDFPGQWRVLCESVGFVLLEEIHASLVKRWEENTLFDGKVSRKKERKSFFRRLHEKRRPDLAIDYEVVLVMQAHIFPRRPK